MARTPKNYNGTTVNGWLAIGRANDSQGRPCIRATKTIDGEEHTTLFTVTAWSSGRVAKTPDAVHTMRHYVIVYLDSFSAEVAIFPRFGDPLDSLDKDRPFLLYRRFKDRLELVHKTFKDQAQALAMMGLGKFNMGPDVNESVLDQAEDAADPTVLQVMLVMLGEQAPMRVKALLASIANQATPAPKPTQPAPAPNLDALMPDEAWAGQAKPSSRAPLRDPNPVLIMPDDDALDAELGGSDAPAD